MIVPVHRTQEYQLLASRPTLMPQVSPGRQPPKSRTSRLSKLPSEYVLWSTAEVKYQYSTTGCQQQGRKAGVGACRKKPSRVPSTPRPKKSDRTDLDRGRGQAPTQHPGARVRPQGAARRSLERQNTAPGRPRRRREDGRRRLRSRRAVQRSPSVPTETPPAGSTATKWKPLHLKSAYSWLPC